MFYPLVIVLKGHGKSTTWRTFQPDMQSIGGYCTWKEMVEPSVRILCNTVCIYICNYIDIIYVYVNIYL